MLEYSMDLIETSVLEDRSNYGLKDISQDLW